MLKVALTSKRGEFAQGLAHSFPEQSVPVLNHPHPEEVLFCNLTGFPFLGLSTVASCVCPKLSVGNTGSLHFLSFPMQGDSGDCSSKVGTSLHYMNLSSLLLFLRRRNKCTTCRNSVARCILYTRCLKLCI